jgi:hypothetical protein
LLGIVGLGALVSSVIGLTSEGSGSLLTPLPIIIARMAQSYWPSVFTSSRSEIPAFLC